VTDLPTPGVLVWQTPPGPYTAAVYRLSHRGVVWHSVEVTRSDTGQPVIVRRLIGELTARIYARAVVAGLAARLEVGA
jgi:hypothetical protein